jgi:hypothetical protein
VCEFGVLIVDDGSFDAAARGSSIGEKLSGTTTIHGSEVGDCFVDGTTHGQKTVVLENDGAVLA